MIYFVNCNWVDTGWQQYSTHLHTDSTQNNTVNHKNKTINNNNNTFNNNNIIKYKQQLTARTTPLTRTTQLTIEQHS